MGDRDATTRTMALEGRSGSVGGGEDRESAVTVAMTPGSESSSPGVESELASAQFGAGPGPAEPKSGQELGRYTLLDRRGAGGMGLVFAARDRQLERTVAIKVLRTDGSDAPEQRSTGQARLLREAQAMAQLSHPHVVEVFDVGVQDGVLYLAMELVEGRSLGRWLKDERPDWRAMVAVFAQAGEGLWAAHQAGMVHRDFKPSNVIVDAQGHARVLDFGLAQAAHARGSVGHGEVPRASQSLVVADRRIATNRLASPVTEVGTVVGTPFYMAPEQHRGDEIGPAADQYAFCAALFEALYGCRPFHGADTIALMKAKYAPIPAAPERHAAPEPLHAALARGLAVDAEQRWPSMEVLLVRLRALAAPPPRRWPWAAAAGIVVAAGVAGLWPSSPSPSSSGVDCQEASASIGRVWGDEAHTALRAALSGDAAYSADTITRVEQHLDDYADHWSSIYAEICESEPAEPDAIAQRQRQLACLDRRRRRMSTLVEVLSDPQSDLLLEATRLTTGLPSLSRCRQPSADDGGLVLPEDPALAAEVEQVLEAMEDIPVLIDAGRYEQAHAHAEQQHARAQALGYAPLLVHAGTWLGDTLVYRGQIEPARAMLEQTLHQAEELGLDAIVVFIAGRLVYLVGEQLGRPEEALTWVRHGEARLSRLADDPRSEAEFRTSVGGVLSAAGRPDEAVQVLSQAVQRWTELVGPDDLHTAAARNNLGIVYYDLGRYADAVAEYEHVRRIRVAALGPEHPQVGQVLNNLGNALSQLGEHERALALRRRTLAIWRSGLGARHLYVAAAYNNLGNSAVIVGLYAEAIDAVARAIEIREEVLGAEHPEVGAARLNLGVAHTEQGQFDEARAELGRARTILEGSVGPEHAWTAACISSLADMEHRRGDQVRAQTLHEDALARLRGAYGDEHPQVGQSHRALGEVLEARGQLDAAAEHLETALAIQQRGDTAPHELAGTRFALARVLRAQGVTPTRARTLAEQAQDAWKDAPEPLHDDREALERWLAASDDAEN